MKLFCSSFVVDLNLVSNFTTTTRCVKFAGKSAYLRLYLNFAGSSGSCRRAPIRTVFRTQLPVWLHLRMRVDNVSPAFIGQINPAATRITNNVNHIQAVVSDPPGVRLTLAAQIGLIETVIQQNACPTLARTPTLAVGNVPARPVRLATASLLRQMPFPKDESCDVLKLSKIIPRCMPCAKQAKFGISNCEFSLPRDKSTECRNKESSLKK